MKASPADVLNGRAPWAIVQRNSLELLRELPTACVDAVITDPPYSSGGLFRGDRNADTHAKYVGSRGVERVSFAGDNRDQRSFVAWCSIWMEEAKRVCRPTGRLLVFSDWRQLPATSDAIQAGGWIWRGVVPWEKGEAVRPCPGGFKHQCEYVLWASAGALPEVEPGVLVLPGWFSHRVDHDDKHHQTGKPTRLMRELVQVVPRGGVVLDPFAGSGTTILAAVLEGRRAIGAEIIPHYADLSTRRIAAALVGADFRHPQQPPLPFDEQPTASASDA